MARAKLDIPAPGWKGAPKPKRKPLALPPLPRAPGSNEQPRAAPADALALAKPPDDPLAVPGHMIKLLGTLATEVMIDPGLKPSTRRAELIKIAREMRGLIPVDRLYQAEQLVKNDRAQLESNEDEPELEDAPAADDDFGDPEPEPEPD